MRCYRVWNGKPRFAFGIMVTISDGFLTIEDLIAHFPPSINQETLEVSGLQ